MMQRLRCCSGGHGGGGMYHRQQQHRDAWHALVLLPHVRTGAGSVVLPLCQMLRSQQRNFATYLSY